MFKVVKPFSDDYSAKAWLSGYAEKMISSALGAERRISFYRLTRRYISDGVAAIGSFL